ncbi:MAG: carboxypeptidase-like regulatory domain-containing protein [Methanosarcinales archaeon]
MKIMKILIIGASMAMLMAMSGIVSANIGYHSEDVMEKIIEHEKEKIDMHRSSIIGASTAVVSTTEYYNYNLGGTVIDNPWLHVSVSDFGEVDNISIELQLPTNVNPTNSNSNVPMKYEYNSATGVLTIKFTDLTNACYWIDADFELEGAKSPPYPITNTPILGIAPKDFDLYDRGTANVVLSEVKLDRIYNYSSMLHQVEDVKNISVVSTTPTEDYREVYIDEGTGPDYYSYAQVYWENYSSVNSLPLHGAAFYLENDCNEVDVRTWIGVEKDVPTQVQVIGASIPYDLFQYTFNNIDRYQTLNPVNKSYGIIKGTVYNKSRVVSYANVYAYGYSVGVCDIGLNTVTDQNGNYLIKVPSGTWNVHAYTADLGSPYSRDITVSYGDVHVVNLSMYPIPTAKVNIVPINTIFDNLVRYRITIENTFDEQIYVDYSGWTDVYYYNESDCHYEYLENSDDFDWNFTERQFYLQPGENKTISADLEYHGTKTLDFGAYSASIGIYVSANDIDNLYYQYPHFSIRGLDCNIYTNKNRYTTGQTQYLGLNITNNNSAQNASIRIWLERPSGPDYTLIDIPSVNLPEGLNFDKADFKSFKLPSIQTGIYTWHIILDDPKTGEIICEDTAQWSFV